MENSNKPNPYIIVIVILLLVVAALLYNQWGNKIMPASVEETEDKNDTIPEDGNVNTEVTDNDIQIGDDDAPVTIVEYYSYFCGYCKAFDDDTKPRLINDYVKTGKVKLVLRPYPPFEAGLAVACANEQEKFSEYHDKLFDEVQNIESVEDLKTIAADVGLNVEEFNQCFDSQKYLELVQKWYQQGNQDFEEAGVAEERRGTPAFFVNNTVLLGARPYEDFVDAIEAELD
ncbi:MAG: thioredoxin domain-containing protein [Candidatus Portnoybacteria bacterium]|nr:thioredoxin domain-containing protein [Candidatus Portnoybacteria bacterium]